MESIRTSVQDSDVRGLKAFISTPGIAEVLVGVAALLAYVGSLAFGFVWDDTVQIVQNPALRHWGSALRYFHQDVWAGLVFSSASFYRPVFMLWLRLNEALFGLQPAGWHAGAITLHAVASVLVFRLAERLTQSRAAACAVGILFALHPVHVESVAWVSGATDSLMTLFICCAVISYLEFDLTGKKRFLSLSVVMASMALLTKETAVLLPVFLGASLLAKEKGSGRLWAIRSLLIFVSLDVLYLVLRRSVLHGAQPAAHMSFGDMILTWPVVLVFYLRDLALPWQMGAYRDIYAVHRASDPGFVGAVILLFIVAMALCWWAFWSSRRGWIIAACAWLFVPLLPVLNLRVFPPGQLVHDRYLYLPCVGFGLLVVAAALDLSEVGGRRIWRIGPALIAATSLAYVVLVFANLLPWASDLLLFKHAEEIAPRNAIAAMNLGGAYLSKGDIEQATAWLERAALLDSGSSDIQLNLAAVYNLQRRFPEANQCLLRSLESSPFRPDGWFLASRIAFDSGDTTRALATAKRALQLWPDGPGYHTVVGIVYWRMGDRVAAEEAFHQELSLHPDDRGTRAALEDLKAGKPGK